MAEQEDLDVEEKYLEDEVGGNASTVYRGEEEDEPERDADNC